MYCTRGQIKIKDIDNKEIASMIMHFYEMLPDKDIIPIHISIPHLDGFLIYNLQMLMKFKSVPRLFKYYEDFLEQVEKVDTSLVGHTMYLIVRNYLKIHRDYVDESYKDYKERSIRFLKFAELLRFTYHQRLYENPTMTMEDCINSYLRMSIE